MTFYFRVACGNCEYESSIVGLGITSRSPCEYHIPVFDPDSGKLDTFAFNELEYSKSGDQLVNWVQSNGYDIIKSKIGAKVIPYGLDGNDTSFGHFICPKCGEMSAHYSDAGI